MTKTLYLRHFQFFNILVLVKNTSVICIQTEAATRSVPTTLLKETLAQVFSCEFCEISKNTFFKEHFWETASLQKQPGSDNDREISFT